MCREPPGPRPGLSFAMQILHNGSACRAGERARRDGRVPPARRGAALRASCKPIVDTHDGVLGGGASRATDRLAALERDAAASAAAREAELRRIDALEKIARSEVPRVGFVRYNAFSDVGSDLSYALALLNARRRRRRAEQHLLARGHPHVRQSRRRVQARAGPVGRRARRDRQSAGGRNVNDAKQDLPRQDHPAQRLQRLPAGVHAPPRRAARRGAAGRRRSALVGFHTYQLRTAESNVRALQSLTAEQQTKLQTIDKQADELAEPAQGGAARERRDQAADRRRPRRAQAARVRRAAGRHAPRRLRRRAGTPAHARARLRDDARGRAALAALAMRVLNLRRAGVDRARAHDRVDSLAQPGRRRDRGSASAGARTRGPSSTRASISRRTTATRCARRRPARSRAPAGTAASASRSTSTTATATTPGTRTSRASR